MDKGHVRTSKFLSLVLRHQPEVIGVSLDAEGWVAVDELLSAAAAHGNAIPREVLDEVVFSNDKQRFAFSPDGLRIRANQGHSIDVNLGLEPASPPPELYHGTASRFLESIRSRGLEKRGRRHVHLSATVATARSVGVRHGKPVVLAVLTEPMLVAGHAFYLSRNGVWLTDRVPYKFIRESDV